MSTSSLWQDVCALDDILVNTGACALVDNRQVAVFRTRDGVYAMDNADPKGGANVLSRGIVGDLKGQVVVASPLYKHHYELATGRCLEEPEIYVPTHRVRLRGQRVEVRRPSGAPRPSGRRRLVVVGNGMAGMRALEELLSAAPHLYDITVFGGEPRGGYNRVLLSSMLSGERDFDQIAGHDVAWYDEHSITLHSGDPVVSIDRVRREVVSRSGLRCGFDRLLLATGATPACLGVPGESLPGVRAFRDVEDVEAMLGAAAKGGRAVVIGGGLLGVEAAAGLAIRGMTVTLLHNSDNLMDRQLDAEAGNLLRESLAQRGIDIRMGVRTQEIVGGQRVEAVVLENGTRIAADLVVTAIGIRPNIALARDAGLQCDRGILVDDTMQTYDPRIWAIGECIQHRNNTFGLVAPLWDQASVCAAHLAEWGSARYSAPPPAASLKVTGIDVFSAGDLHEDQDSQSIVLRDPERGIYKRIVLRGNRVCGAVLYGEVCDGAHYSDLMREGANVDDLRETLLFGAIEGAA